ncbi:hypothetical protein [Thiosulfatihalobacter marinus]|uniref:hypothetical protein n=2 Tax=Thiosulfatihalobacter marinus TaxID=2792481 RepID=UPI001E3B2F6D|nr:hypothetical protein [Thiosulfatihalobacter marinus]
MVNPVHHGVKPDDRALRRAMAACSLNTGSVTMANFHNLKALLLVALILLGVMAQGQRAHAAGLHALLPGVAFTEPDAMPTPRRG